jgi:hypothetical protein
MEVAMNHSVDTADGLTHLKIVVTALVIAIGVVWIGLAVHTNDGATNFLPSKVNRLVVAPVKLMIVAPLPPPFVDLMY